MFVRCFVSCCFLFVCIFAQFAVQMLAKPFGFSRLHPMCVFVIFCRFFLHFVYVQFYVVHLFLASAFNRSINIVASVYIPYVELNSIQRVWCASRKTCSKPMRIVAQPTLSMHRNLEKPNRRYCVKYRLQGHYKNNQINRNMNENV